MYFDFISVIALFLSIFAVFRTTKIANVDKLPIEDQIKKDNHFQPTQKTAPDLKIIHPENVKSPLPPYVPTTSIPVAGVYNQTQSAPTSIQKNPYWDRKLRIVVRPDKFKD